MKKNLLTVAALACTLSMFAQGVQDSVSVGLSYANRSYYSLANGEAANVPNTGWDLAFDLAPFGSSIRSNGQAGVNVFLYPNGDASAWATADTAGISNWPVLHNTSYSWDIGAFERHVDVTNPFDLGWGVYNQINHTVFGDSVYFIQPVSGPWKKIMIESMNTGAFQFKHANLDGSNEVTEIITKANYPGKRFVYYSIPATSLLDIEPVVSSWDILFTKYVEELAPQTYYGVTGVMSNKHIKVAVADGLADPYAVTDYSTETFDSLANSLGYDWKSFNNTTFTYEIVDSTAYFLKDTAGAVYRLVFEKFEGAATGKIVFHKQALTTISLDENNMMSSFSVYPNPSTGLVNIAYELDSDGFANVLDLSGKTIQSASLKSGGFYLKTLDLSRLSSGIYLIQIYSGNQQQTQQIIIE